MRIRRSTSRSMLRLPLVLLVGPTLAAGQATARDDAEAAARDRITRVEHGLLPAVAIEGRPDTAFALAERMRRYGVPGVSIAVIDRGRIAWARAYGVVESGRAQPVDTATRFQAGSISKAVTSVVALRLVDRGAVRLDDDVNHALLSWRVPESEHTRTERVTLRRLLSHSAGLDVAGFPGYSPGAPLPTVPQLLDGAPPANTPAVRVTSRPGAAWRYSGGGTMVVQQLLVDVTGDAFEALVRRELFAPAGMTHSTFAQPLGADQVMRAATGHSPADAPLPGRWRVHPELAAAGLWSTPSDLARFALAVQRSLGPTAHGARATLLESATARLMLTPHAGTWGLGFAIAGAGDSVTFGHDGSTAGFTCRLLAFRDGRGGVVIMTNGESDALVDEIVRSVAREYRWPTAARPVKRVAAVDAAGYRALAGRYRIALGGGRHVDVLVTAERERIYFTGSSGRPAELLPESPLRFFARDSGTEFTFARGARGGRADTLWIDQAGQRFAAHRVP